MPRMNEIYKNKIHLIVVDTIKNYINATHINPDENQFREWLKNKQIYYSNRITNKIVSKWKPNDKAMAVGYVAMEIERIRENEWSK